MKFLIACGIVPPDIGGPATIIVDLAKKLSSAGHLVTIVTYTEAPLAIDGARIVSVGRRGTVLARYARFFKALIANIDRDSVLMAMDCFSTGIPVRLALIGRPNRFFLRLGGEWRWEHAIESGRYFGTLRDFWKRRVTIRDYFENVLYRWILHRAKAVLLNSTWFANLLKEYIPASYALYRAPLFEASGIVHRDREPHDPLKLLYVGRFANVKNVVFLAKIFKSLSEEGVRFHVTFIGDGETKSTCEEMLKNVPGIVFLGKKNHAEIQAQMACHDIFVLPSLTDIYPNAILEALASGLPCVMTSEHGLSMKLSGVIECNPLQEEEWKRAIRALQSPEAYKTLAREIGFLNTSQQEDLTTTILLLCESSK